MNKNSLNNLYHIPLSKEKVINSFIKNGYTIINYNYKNNETRMCCFDKEGYKVMVSYDSLVNKKVKIFQRFSTTCNEENFLFNTNLYIKKNNLHCIALNWRKSLVKNHIDILCRCQCGNEYWCDFNWWRRSLKDRCNKCVKATSNIAFLTQQWLDENKIQYIKEYRFKNCKDKRPLPFDFYLPEYNYCIEVDGEQHFYDRSERCFKTNLFTDEDFKDRKNKDNIKTKYCLDNGIKLIRLKYNLFRRNGIIIDNYKNKLSKEITIVKE